jgi:hypothetical protein
LTAEVGRGEGSTPRWIPHAEPRVLPQEQGQASPDKAESSRAADGPRRSSSSKIRRPSRCHCALPADFQRSFSSEAARARGRTLAQPSEREFTSATIAPWSIGGAEAARRN